MIKEEKTMIDSLLGEIRSGLKAKADPARVKKYARFFVEGYDAYGVDLKGMREERERWFREYQAELGLEGFLQAGKLLVQSGKYEEGFIAIDLIYPYRKNFTPAVFDRLGSWLDDGFCNWAHVDSFSSEILPVFLIQHIVPLAAFSSWRNAPSKWKRRAVPVTLIKTLKTDLSVERMLEFIDPMMGDQEKVVQQGLGWFLREAWKLNPQPVEKFLLNWKDRCARLIIQYSTEKMTKEQKSAFKKSTQ
jgi:3-methyladenine DNA glycosylase AlkD